MLYFLFSITKQNNQNDITFPNYISSLDISRCNIWSMIKRSRQVFLLYILSKQHAIILYYYSIFWQGHSLHFRNHSYFWNPGYVFHPHINHQISPPSNHKLYQIYTQFIPNIQIYFDTHFDKTQYFSNKTKLSDN